MENRYPLFVGGRILKKEALWDLRDYAYGGWQLYYADYTDGVLKGCRVRVDGMDLVIGKGMLKYHGFIYLLQEEVRMPYTAENRTVALKAAFHEEAGNPDCLEYKVCFSLDGDLALQANQAELCRFHLREGSRLRDAYKDFADRKTEYDTVSLLHATMAGRGRGRMHPEILLQYAKEMQRHDIKSMEDIAFCYMVLQNVGEVERDVVDAYLAAKQPGDAVQEICQWENIKCFDKLESILNCHGSSYDGGQRRKVIVVD